jgi:hypothetical protein
MKAALKAIAKPEKSALDNAIRERDRRVCRILQKLRWNALAIRQWRARPDHGHGPRQGESSRFQPIASAPISHRGRTLASKVPGRDNTRVDARLARRQAPNSRFAIARAAEGCAGLSRGA